VVGLVLVGHSEEVVRGAVAMVAQAAPAVPVAGAGGLEGGRLGTNGLEVAQALRAVLAETGRDGILVLIDLGSASMAVDVALDDLDPAERELVRVSEAPFIEGAVLAAVAAAAGDDLEAVAAAAEGARTMPKRPRDERVDTGRPTQRQPAEQVALAMAWLRGAARVIHERRAWLTDLDAAIGDGDHGINLDRGFTAVLADLEAGTLATDGVGPLLTASGRRLLGVVGGASGALYGRALMTAGARLAEHAREAHPGRVALVTTALAGAIDGITALGRAVPGDKTMLDALVPALLVLRDAGQDEPADAVLARAAAAAEAGALATIPLVARKGRASYLGERSAGHLDPGAASSAILVRCLADAAAGARDAPAAAPANRPPG